MLNADDPLIADLGRERDGVLYFGIEDDRLALPELAHAADAKHCRRCGAPYRFDAIYLGHLGRYHCEQCGAARPTRAVTAHDVALHGTRGGALRAAHAGRQRRVELALPGLYNVYNALAAAALATALEARRRSDRRRARQARRGGVRPRRDASRIERRASCASC